MISLLLIAVLGASDGALPERERYAFPFDSYPSWAELMEKSPDAAQRPSALQHYLSEKEFGSCVAGEQVSLERLHYASDGLRVRAILAKPKKPITRSSARLVVFPQGDAARWGKITTLDVFEFCHLAEQGFAVVAPTFRGEGSPTLGTGERVDVSNLLKAIAKIPGLDHSRLALWGFSSGRGTGYRVLAHDDRFQVAILQAAAADFVGDPRRAEFHEHVYPGVVEGYESDPDRALARLSAVQWPEKISKKTRIVLVHGTNDTRVPYESSVRMEKLLRETGHEVELISLAGGHSQREHWLEGRKHMSRTFAPLILRTKRQ